MNHMKFLPSVGPNPVEQCHGIYMGIVTHTRSDGWVKLQIPQVLGKTVSDWARPLGSNGNSYPAVGSLVVAMFLGGDQRQPSYMVTSQVMHP